jgi:hypothetical protein
VSHRIGLVSMLTAVFILGLAVSSALTGATYAEPLHERVQIGDVFTIVSKRGIAIVDGGDGAERRSASLTLTVRVVEVGERWFKFKVEGGSIEVDGVAYPVTSGEGSVRFRVRPGAALIGLKGEVQGGIFHLRGAAFPRWGGMTAGLGGPLHVGDTVYRLRFLAAPVRPAA